jgi:hypothetical protein
MAAKQHPAEELPSQDDTIEQKAERLLRLANSKLSDTAFIRSTVGWIAAYQKDVCEELLEASKRDIALFEAAVEFFGAEQVHDFIDHYPVFRQLHDHPTFKTIFKV